MTNFLMGRLAGLQKFNNETNRYCLLRVRYTRLDSYTPLFLQFPSFKTILSFPIPPFPTSSSSLCFLSPPLFTPLLLCSHLSSTNPPHSIHVNQPHPTSPPMDSSPPPSPFHIPHQSSLSSNSFPVIAIAVIGILATAFLLVGYYLFVIKCCLNWHRIDVLNRFSSRRRTNPTDSPPPDFATSEATDNTKGLDEAIIRAIPVIKFRKVPEKERENVNNNGPKRLSETASYECAVCLSEFEDGERLRVIPNCCHAFHIDCIDIWLQSNANCPLCRLWISPSSILYNDRIFLGSSTQENPTTSSDNFSGSDDDYVVIEIQGNNLDEPRLVKTRSEGRGERKKGKKLCSMGDEWIDMKREKDEEFRIVQPIRRSISMDLSTDREFCLEIQQCCSSTQMSEISLDSSRDCSSSSRVRRSIFSFGYGRNSRGSVQPVHLSPP